MCGRFSIIDDIDAICKRFNCIPVDLDFRPRYNAAPTQKLPVIISNGEKNELTMMRWGLIPNWARDKKIGNKLINARIETVAEKPAYKNSLRQRRCIIPASGYYEWEKTVSTKIPHRIIMDSGQMFGFAGLWDRWQEEQGKEILSFTIITTSPVPAVSSIHTRMPFILAREQEEYWLNGLQENLSSKKDEFLKMLVPAENLRSYQVSTLVNSTRNDVPECIERID